MPQSPTHRDPEELLRHTAWVRSLAAGLLGDAALAEDVVQETWLAALRRSSAERASRSWLAAVAGNHARMQRRSRERGVRRERAAAQPEALPAADEVAALEEERRRLVAAVLDLPEPSRNTVLLHYWSGLSPAAIAQRDGLPASTVRNRLKRARARLRHRLETAPGQARRTALAVLGLPLVPSSTPWTSFASTLFGALAVSTPVKLCAALPLVLLIWWGWNSWSSTEEVTPVDAPIARVQAASARVDPEPERLAAKQPLELAPDEPVERDAPPAAPSTLFGQVHDGEGRPVDGALVIFEGPDGELLHTRADAMNGYELPGVPRVAGTLRAWSASREQHCLEIQPREERERHDLVLPPAQGIRVRFVTPEGRPLPEAMEDEGSGVGFLLRDSLFAIATADPPPERIASARPLEHHGLGIWTRAGRKDEHQGVLICEAPLPLHLSAVLCDRVLQTQLVPPGTEEIQFEIPLEEVAARGAGLRFRLVDADTGLDLPRPSVGLSNASSVRLGGRPEPDGSFLFEGLAWGSVGLWIRTREHAPYFAFHDLQPGELRDLGTLELQPAAALPGRVVTPSADPVESWVHDFGELDPAAPMFTNIVFHSTDEYGQFNLRRRPGPHLVVVAPKGDWGRAALLLEGTEEDPSPLELVVQPAVSVRLEPHFRQPVTVRVLDPAGHPLFSQRMSCLSQDLKLSAGRYTVEVRHAEALVLQRELEVVGNEPVVVDLVAGLEPRGD